MSPATTESELLAPAILEKVKALVLALDRTIRSQRLYAENNPILVRHRQDLLRLFGEYLDANGECSFTVEPFEFLVSGASVYKNENEQESFAFKLFNDGIRSLTFKPGLTDQELVEFLTTLAAGLSAEKDDADAVTSFWEKEFEHIRYTVADLIIDGPNDQAQKSTDEKIEEILDPKMTQYHGAAEEYDEEVYQTVGSDELKITLNVVSVGAMFDNRTVLNGDELKEIQADIAECDQPERLVLDFVDMVLAVLQEETDKAEFQKALEALGTILDHNLANGQLQIAAMIMEQVHAFPARPIQMTKIDSHLLPNTLRSLWTPERVLLFFQALNLDPPPQAASIEKLIRLMDSNILPNILEHLPSIAQPHTRQVVAKAVASLHKGDIGIFTKLLSSRDSGTVQAGMEVLSHLKNEKVVDMLAPFIQRRDHPLRKEAIEVLRNYRSSKAYRLLLG